MNARRPWLLYFLVLFLGLGGMGWITLGVVRTARSEAAAQRQASVDEKVRQAIWRMETSLQLFLAPETARPYFHYEPFHRVEGRRQPMPSPMLMGSDPVVLLRFQVDAAGHFSSPLVPPSEVRALVAETGVSPQRLREAAHRLTEVQGLLDRASIQASMVTQGAVLPTREDLVQLQSRIDARSSFTSPYQIIQGAWTPFWQGDSLFMVRQVWVGTQELLQGCWLDWGQVKEFLLSTVREGLPQANLVPVQGIKGDPLSGCMASLPVRLVPGRLPRPARATALPGLAALWVGWLLALLGAAAGGLVLKITLELSQRREAFASAVTHELRTPLTTFRLYTELLAHDMVPEEQERKGLLRTLLVEADRLDHLVRNVLAYSRMEARGAGQVEALSLGDMLARAIPRLQERARQSGLRLELEGAEPFKTFILRTDFQVVEQILLNLVDNACKYAGQVADRPLLLQVSREPDGWTFRLRDHGPGISPLDRRRLFRPFEKLPNALSRQSAGVGLGLALCRELARRLGGDLTYKGSPEPGACFGLRLPD